MGGKALKNTITRRYQREEFFAMQDKVASMMPYGWSYRFLPAYRNKQSFGDLDVLVLNNGTLGNFKDAIQERYSPNEIFVNNSVYSFNVDELQVDFIFTPELYFETSYNYFAWNDLGNFVGKIAHKFGLKYGAYGLRYIYRSKDGARIIGEINLSQDPKTIFDFLGFDHHRWLLGFDEKTDIFDFIIASKYFNYEIFTFEGLSSIHKHRNIRRDMYHEFLEYAKDRKEPYQFENDKSAYFQMIENSFPGFLERKSEYEALDDMRASVKEKFNGRMVMERYGLTGADLGNAIQRFTSTFRDDDDMVDFILKSPPDAVWSRFEDSIKDFKI